MRGRGQLVDCRAALVPACHRRIDGLLPTQSISGHTFRDRLHLIRSDALELRRFAAGDVKAAMASTERARQGWGTVEMDLMVRSDGL